MSTSKAFARSLARLPATNCRQTQRIYSQARIPAIRPSQCSTISRHSLVPQSAWATVWQSRTFTTTLPRRHGHIKSPKPGEEYESPRRVRESKYKLTGSRLHITFIDKDGEEFKFAVSEGDNLLDIAQANDVEMEGACGGSCACSTCHVIVTEDSYYDKIPEPDDDENDMLDLAFGLTETSRLGCQVKMTKELDGLVVKLPSMTRNLQASDFNS